ncbi:MAG: gas vesicle protein GvpN [Clostridiales bacterium GWE2_32_10]|nr:MAG: gas vesicle protein GvpN [Clostridiales bacterium GWE2_32_10]HBY19668.1 gas vesicle protein GvpN [Clostridiales bacterium]
MSIHEKFVVTPQISSLIDRSLIYLQAGFPIHFKGPAGTGKTALAVHIANKFERPVMIMFGNEEFERSDLLGNSYGLKRKIVFDNYVSSVAKQQEEVEVKWIDGRILQACKNGYILIYDEFTRSRPETNNVFLSILEEKIIETNSKRNGKEVIRIHPDFRVIFTSNPVEYAGVHKLQDALKDRMITLSLDFPDRETEIQILKAQAKIVTKIAETIVDIIRRFRELKDMNFSPTIRSGIIIAKSIKVSKLETKLREELFKQICRDVILSEKSNSTALEKEKIINELNKIISDVFDKA